MPTKQQFMELKDAYVIENGLLAAWLTQGSIQFASGSIQGDFQKTWDNYFRAVIESNSKIMEICDSVISGDITPADGKEKIVERQHIEENIDNIKAATFENQNGSDYLISMDKVVGYEKEICNKIREFLA
jgi:hypothetical protein